MEHQIYLWAIDLAQKASERRAWDRLPHDFQYAAVKTVVEELRPHWDKNGDIRARIAATQAHNFYDLIEAIKSAKPREKAA